MLRIGIIVGSTRPGRKARAVAEWVHDQGAGRPDAQFEVVDLADFDLTHLDEPVPALFGQYSHDHTHTWSATISALDAFVAVVPEYNQSFPGALTTALDFLYEEWNNKAIGFVGYGVGGGGRSVEQLRHVAAALKLADVGPQVALHLSTDVVDGQVVGQRPLDQLGAVIDDLLAWRPHDADVVASGALRTRRPA